VSKQARIFASTSGSEQIHNISVIEQFVLEANLSAQELFYYISVSILSSQYNIPRTAADSPDHVPTQVKPIELLTKAPFGRSSCFAFKMEQHEPSVSKTLESSPVSQYDCRAKDDAVLDATLQKDVPKLKNSKSPIMEKTEIRKLFNR
jgi:hypothetical protein